MAFEDLYKKATEESIDLEKLFLVLLFASSAYMVWDTLNFSSSSAARFPRLTAGTVLVGSLLLLFRGYLPDRLEAAIAEPSEIFQADEEVTEKQKQAEQRSETETEDEIVAETETTDISVVGRPIHDSLFTALAIAGYAFLGYAIGIFLATPVFVAGYTKWFKFDWPRILGLTLLGTFIAYLFVWALGIPLDRGEIFFTSGVLDQLPLIVTGVL